MRPCIHHDWNLDPVGRDQSLLRRMPDHGRMMQRDLLDQGDDGEWVFVQITAE